MLVEAPSIATDYRRIRRNICTTTNARGVHVGGGDQEHIIQLGQCVSWGLLRTMERYVGQRMSDSLMTRIPRRRTLAVDLSQ